MGPVRDGRPLPRRPGDRATPAPGPRPRLPALAANAPLGTADDAGRALALLPQLHRQGADRPARRPRRRRPLQPLRQVRAGRQRTRQGLPARLAPARLLDPGRRRGAASLRRDRHLVRLGDDLLRGGDVAALALDRAGSRRAGVLRLLQDDRVDLDRRDALRALSRPGDHPRPNGPDRVQLPGDGRGHGGQHRAQPDPASLDGDRRRRRLPGRLLRGGSGAHVRLHPAPLQGAVRVAAARPGDWARGRARARRGAAPADERALGVGRQDGALARLSAAALGHRLPERRGARGGRARDEPRVCQGGPHQSPRRPPPEEPEEPDEEREDERKGCAAIVPG